MVEIWGPSRAEITVIESDSELETEVLGIPESWSHGAYPDFVRGLMYLRSWIHNETGAVDHQLFVEATYFGNAWIDWFSAKDDRGRSLAFIPMDRREDQGGSLSGNCEYHEAFGIPLSENCLQAQSEGLRVTVVARKGPDLVLSVIPGMIGAQFEALAGLGHSDGLEERH